jgi:hypothetical protein
VSDVIQYKYFKTSEMEMEIGSAIVGAVSIAIVTLPVVLLGRNKRKKSNHLKSMLAEIAAEHDRRIGQLEIAGNLAIALDETKNFVFFCAQEKERVDTQYIYLGKMQACKVINTSRMLKSKEGNQKVIDKLELCFIPKAKEQPELRLEFFNADVNPQLYGELQTVEKWSKLINAQLKGKN